MLSLYKLEIFAVVVETGSFSTAAKHLLMSQPAVSQHIQDIEHSLGVQLFHREWRGVTLTTAGHTLHHYTQKILRLVSEAENAVTDINQLTEGQVRIGATPGISVYLLPEWIQTFRRCYPNLTATLQTDIASEIVTSVLQHSLDVGFIEGEMHETEHERLIIHVLQQVQLWVVVGREHAWWQLPSINMNMLHRQAFITRQSRSKTRIWVDQLLRQHQVQPTLVAELDNLESIKHLVAAGLGVSILPEYTIRAELAAGTLRNLPIENLPLLRTLKLIWAADRTLSPVTRAFLHHLADKHHQPIHF